MSTLDDLATAGAVAIIRNSSATGSDTVAIGQGAQASADTSGAWGWQVSAPVQQSFAWGHHVVSRIQGGFYGGDGGFLSTPPYNDFGDGPYGGTAQWLILAQRCVTLDDTPTQLTSDGQDVRQYANTVFLSPGSTVARQGVATARCPDTGELMAWQFSLVANRKGSGQITLGQSVSRMPGVGGAPWSFSVEIDPDPVHYAVALVAHGEANKRIQWLASSFGHENIG